MRKAIYLGKPPYVQDYFKKDASVLFDETGGNTGNLAFQYAVATHLRSDVPVLHWGMNAKQFRSSGDIIVLPLANQLGCHTDLASAAAKLNEIELPVIGVGLGAQAASLDADVQLSEGTRDWLDTIASLSPTGAANLGVRGTYTQVQISKNGWPHASVVTGCPSNFINLGDDFIDQIAAGFQRRPALIAVAAGIPYSKHLASLEHNLADMVTATGGAYIVQHGLEMLRLARNEFDALPPDLFTLCHEYIQPSSSPEEFKAWCRRFAYAFYDVRAWMDFLRRFDFVVGTRFHGAMLAIQAGIPAACIAHDSRTYEMCQTMKVPVCLSTEINLPLTPANLLEHFRFDADEFRVSRRQLLSSYIALFRDAEVELAQPLVAFAAS
jgi:Polysaccharide pyruvyl transferase